MLNATTFALKEYKWFEQNYNIDRQENTYCIGFLIYFKLIFIYFFGCITKRIKLK